MGAVVRNLGASCSTPEHGFLETEAVRLSDVAVVRTVKPQRRYAGKHPP